MILKKVSKLLNNPITMLALILPVYLLTKSFIYLSYMLIGYVTAQVLLEKITIGKVSQFLFVSWLLIIPFGIATILLRDPLFLQWKFSIVYWLFSLILIISYIMKGPIVLKTLFSLGGGKVNDIPLELLKKLTFVFAFGFISIGFINTYFIYFTSFDTWVTFKFIGAPILLILITALPTYYFFSKAEITEKQ